MPVPLAWTSGTGPPYRRSYYRGIFNKLADALDGLYAEKKEIEAKELLEAIAKSSKTKTEILAFLESA